MHFIQNLCSPEENKKYPFLSPYTLQNCSTHSRCIHHGIYRRGDTTITRMLQYLSYGPFVDFRFMDFVILFVNNSIWLLRSCFIPTYAREIYSKTKYFLPFSILASLGSRTRIADISNTETQSLLFSLLFYSHYLLSIVIISFLRNEHHL